MSRVGSRYAGLTAVVAMLLNLGTASTALAAVDEVIVVFKTHFDIGYTDLARNVVSRYRTSMIDNALAVCDSAKGMPSEQRFVWDAVRLADGSDPRAGAVARTPRADRAGYRRRPAGVARPAGPRFTPSRSTWRTWYAAWRSRRALAREFGMPLPPRREDD